MMGDRSGDIELARAARCPDGVSRDYETTPIQTTFSATETVTIVDPRHPLYGRTFPLIDIANRSHIGQACVIQLRDDLERTVPLAVTDRASESVAIFPLSLNLSSVRQLLRAFRRITSQLKEGTEDGVICRNAEDGSNDSSVGSGDTCTADIAGARLELAVADAEEGSSQNHRASVSSTDAVSQVQREGGDR